MGPEDTITSDDPLFSNHPIIVTRDRLQEADGWIHCSDGEPNTLSVVRDTWERMSLNINWDNVAEVLHFTCGFIFETPPDRLANVQAFLDEVSAAIPYARITARSNCILYLSGLPIPEDSTPCPFQIDRMIETALYMCTDLYPHILDIATRKDPDHTDDELELLLQAAQGEA